MYKYPNLKLRSIANITQKCVDCKQWFGLPQGVMSELVEAYRQHDFDASVSTPCTKCGKRQIAAPIGKYDAPQVAQRDCNVQCIQYRHTTVLELLARVKELRYQNGVEAGDINFNKLTRANLEQLVYDLETQAIDHRSPPPEVDLFAQLNCLRKKHSMPPLRTKPSKAVMQSLIDTLTRKVPAGIEVKKGETKIAEGADTTAFRTGLHNNKVRRAVERQNKHEARAHLKSQRAAAEAVATALGFERRNVMLYLQVNRIVKVDPPYEALREKIVAFVKARDEALHHDKKRSSTPRVKVDCVTPHDIAQALKKDPRAVRVILRRIEKKIPKAWRVEGERWGFKPENKAQIIKLIGG